MGELMDVLRGIEDFTSKPSEDIVIGWITEKGYHMGNVMNAFRLAVVGECKGPHMFDITELLGKEETLARIEKSNPDIMMYPLLRFFLKLFSCIPWCILYALSDGLFCLLYYVAGYRRKIVRQNLTESFPEKSLPEIRQIEKRLLPFLCGHDTGKLQAGFHFAGRIAEADEVQERRGCKRKVQGREIRFCLFRALRELGMGFLHASMVREKRRRRPDLP